MRQIATLVLAALLVAGTLPAVGSAGVAQHDTDAQYTTDLGDGGFVAGELQADAAVETDGVVATDADGAAMDTDGAAVVGAATNHTDAAVTGYAVADRVVNPEQPLRLLVRGDGQGPTSVPLTVDGVRLRLGTVNVTPVGASFAVARGINDTVPLRDARCWTGSDDGFYFGCEFELDAAALGVGTHQVGVDDMAPTSVEVDPEEAYLSGVTIRNDTLQPGGTLHADPSFAGESGSVPIDLTLDGEVYRYGTAHVRNGSVTFDPVEDDGTLGGFWPPVPEPPFPCLPPRCDVIPIPLRSPVNVTAGVHTVGINGLDTTEIVVGEQLELTDYEIEGGVRTGDEREVTIYWNETTRSASLNVTVRGEGVGEAPLSLSVDGERRRLGTIHATADGVSFAPYETDQRRSTSSTVEGTFGSPLPDHDGFELVYLLVDVDCTYVDDLWARGDPLDLLIICDFEYEWYYVPEEPTIVSPLVEKRITANTNTVETTLLNVEPHDARLADYELHDRTVEVGGTLRTELTVAGKTGVVPVDVTVDGRQYRAGTVTVENGSVTDVDLVDASEAPFTVRRCPSCASDDPQTVGFAIEDVQRTALGTHEISVDGLEPTTVTVESRTDGLLGGLITRTVDLVVDVVTGIGHSLGGVANDVGVVDGIGDFLGGAANDVGVVAGIGHSLGGAANGVGGTGPAEVTVRSSSPGP